MDGDKIDAEIRTLAQDRRLPAAHVDRWLEMDPASRDSMLTHVRSLALRTGQIVSALELLEEISVRERVTIAEILSRDEIRRIADARGSTPARASAFIDALRQTRFPRLRKMQERLRAEIAALKLPRGISLDLPKELGSDELTVSLRARSAGELDKLVGALNRSSAGIARIVELLGGGGSRSDDADEI
jgi:hypothetical protein